MIRLLDIRLGAAVLGVALCACTTGRIDLASAFVKSSQIGAQGGTISVSTSDDQSIAGTTITVPAGALAQNVVITVSPSAQPVAPSGTRAAGPVVHFGPDGTTFAKPVTIQLPYVLPAGATVASLFVEAVESDGTSHKITVSATSGSLATFQASGFTSFGCVTADSDGGSVSCQADSDCPAGESCSSGECVGPASDGGPAGCATDSDCGSCLACINGVCETHGTTCSVDAGPAACRADSDCGGSCQVCVSGVCEQSSCTSDAGPACGGNEINCSGFCIDTTSDAENCGACGVECPSGASCGNGVCATSSLTCSTDSDCPSCEACENGSCFAVAQPCEVDGGPASGVSCRTNSDCPSGQTCVANICS